MDQLPDQNHLIRLKRLGVRTDKRIEIMYSDLYRITENIFLKECHATEAFELYDFVKEKEKYRELHELRRHMEGLLQWMYPEGLPSWPNSTNRRFKALNNPYLLASLDPIPEEGYFNPGNQEISAAFNIRCGKPGARFRKEREILLEKLQDRHFSAVALEDHLKAGKDNTLIPPIGLDLMKQEIYLLEPLETFLSEEIKGQSYSKAWYEKYLGIFENFSNTGLTAFYNQRVERDNSSPARQGILVALRGKFQKRGIDFSSIENKGHLHMKQCAVLVDKKLHTVKELPRDVVEMMVRWLRNKKDQKDKKIEICEIDDKDIFWWEKGFRCSLNQNYLLQFFYKQLLEQP